MTRIFLEGTDADEFSQAIVKEVVRQLEPLLVEYGQPRLVNTATLAELLSVSVTTINRMKRDGEIPYRKIGTRVLFNAQEVIDSLPVTTDATTETENVPVSSVLRDY